MISKQTLNQPAQWQDAILLALLCACLQFFMPHLKLLTDHTAFYTLLTGHFVHLHWLHYALNMSAALLLILLMSQFKRVYLLSLSIVLSLGISALLLQTNQLHDLNVYSYVGFSGVLHGIFTYAALNECAYYRHNTDPKARYFYFQSIVLLLALILKVAYELIFDPQSTSDLLGSPVVHMAHFDGMALATGLFVIKCVCDQRRSA